jgi:hypothetical protein
MLKWVGVMSHDTDFYSWTQEQAALLRQGRLNELDIAHLIEEVEDMGASERRELKNRLVILLVHLLKWRYQSSKREYGHSWEYTIRGQRFGIGQCLGDNPGLKSTLEATKDAAYKLARFDAANETGLKLITFPTECPWALEQVLNDEFWPE